MTGKQTLPRVSTADLKSVTISDAVRAAVEGAIGEIPIAGAVVPLAQQLVSNAKQRAQSKWQEDVSHALNQTIEVVEAQSRQMQPHEEKIEGLTARLASYLVETSSDGMEAFYELEKLIKEVPGNPTIDELRDAADELASLGVLEMLMVIGPSPGFRTSSSLFEAFDSQVMKFDTRVDAANLASRIIDDENMHSVPALHHAVGWVARRFNPALTFLLRFIADEHIGHEHQATYPTMWLAPDGAELHALRRFVKSVVRDAPQPQT